MLAYCKIACEIRKCKCTFSNDTQPHDIPDNYIRCYAECRCADCLLFTVMLSAVVLSVALPFTRDEVDDKSDTEHSQL